MSAPVRVAEFRSTHTTGGGPDKTILFSAARHDPSRVRVVPVYLARPGDDLPGIRDLAARAGVEPVVVPDRGRLDPGVIPAVARLLRRERCTVLHAHDFKTDVLGPFLARAVPGLRLLATAHGWSRPMGAAHRLYNFLDRRALRRYPAVLAVSGDTAARLRGFGVRAERLVVVPNAIDVEVWRPPESPAAPLPGFAPGRRVVGTVGRLSIDKDVDGLLAAFARLAPEFADVDLAVLGDGPERERLAALAASLGLTARVRFLGHVGDARAAYAAMEVFVLSSRTEGLPNTLLEAMAMGRPVAASAVGGVPEVVRDGTDGILVPAGDVDALAAALRRLLTDPAGAEAMGRRARERVVARFAFADRVRRMEEIYLELDATGRVAPGGPPA